MPSTGFFCSPMAAAPRRACPSTGAEIRAAFLDFYEQRGHQPIASASRQASTDSNTVTAQ